MSRPRFRVFRRRHAAWWTLGAGLAVTAVLAWVLHLEAVELDRLRLVQRAAEIQTVLDSRLERSEMLLQNLRDYLTWSGERRNEAFVQWCYDNGLSINCPWVLGIAVATNRQAVALPSGLDHPPSAWTLDEWEALAALAWRQPIECELVLRSRVEEGRTFLADYDLRGKASDHHQPGNAPTSRSRLMFAIHGSSVGMSHRGTVMLDSNRNPILGTVFYRPVYRREVEDFVEANPSNRGFLHAARWMHLSEVIVAPVDFKRLIGSAEHEAADVGIEVFSSTNRLDAGTWMNPDRPTPRAADPAFRASLTHVQPWRMYRQRFALFFYTKPLFEAQSPHRLVRTTAWAGFAVTVLATALVGVSVRARNRQDRLTAQIREARDALAAAQRERERISRDLHDGTIQSLYAIQLGLGHTADRLRTEPADAGSELSSVRRELNAVIAEIRQFITAETALETQPAADLGAVLQALTGRAQGGSAARIGLECDAEASARVTNQQAVQLANIAREALSNALRHGQPRRVDLRLRLEQGFVVLEVADDGVGFSPGKGGDSGLGLGSMSARAAESGGTLTVDSRVGHGTRVTARLPAGPARAVDFEAPESGNGADDEP